MALRSETVSRLSITTASVAEQLTTKSEI